MPDSSIMLELCEILGITMNELFRGKKTDAEGYEKNTMENPDCQKNENKHCRPKNRILSILFQRCCWWGF